MARGQQKLQSQQKNQKKQQELKKGAVDHKASAQKALLYLCTVCKAQMPDPKTYRQHFESKHPKSPMPPECEESTSTSA